MALQPNSRALGTGDPTTCLNASGPNNLDQRGISHHATSRGVCDIGAYDKGSAIPVSIGWDLIDPALYTGSPTTASGLAAGMNSQLSAG